MNGYWLTGICAAVLGAALGAVPTYLYENDRLATEQAAHARDNEQHANDLSLISKAALDAETRAIDAHTVAEGKIATLDAQITQEKQAHEADNARNRALIADGTRRLRIAVSNFHPAGGDQAGTGTSASSVGDGATGYADLAPAFGSALFGIVDDDDKNDRAKVIYLQGYVSQLEASGYISTPADQK